MRFSCHLGAVGITLLLWPTLSLAKAGETRSLGILDVPGSRASLDRKYVFVQGVRVVGKYQLSYRDGKLFLGRTQIAPTPEPARQPPRADGLPEHSEALLTLAPRLPYVSKATSKGASLTVATRDYLHAVNIMLETVTSTYREQLPNGKSIAEQKARALIDPMIAENDPASAQAPRFSECGGVSLFLKNFVWLERGCNTPESTGPTNAEMISLDDAIERVRVMRGYLSSPGTSVIIFAESGNMWLHASPQAVEAANEIEDALSGKPGRQINNGERAILSAGVRSAIIEAKGRTFE